MDVGSLVYVRVPKNQGRKVGYGFEIRKAKVVGIYPGFILVEYPKGYKEGIQRIDIIKEV